MHRLMHNPEDVYCAGSRMLFRPGERDPEWLLRAAEHERVLRLMKAESKPAMAPNGIVARLRLALSRA